MHDQFSQSSSRPYIPRHFKWPSSIFQDATINAVVITFGFDIVMRNRACEIVRPFHETHHRYLPQQEGFENLLFTPDAGIHIDEYQVHLAITDHLAFKLLIRIFGL